jgi:hypothetical protein
MTSRVDCFEGLIRAFKWGLLQEAQIAAYNTRTSPHFISAGLFRRPTRSTEQPNSRSKQLNKDTAKQNATSSIAKWNEFTLSIGLDKS